MRKHLSLLTVVVVVLLLGADSPQDYGDAATLDGLDGSWLLVKCEVAGQELDVPSNYQLIFRGGAYTWTGWLPMTGTYKVDPSHKPGHLEEMAVTGALKGLSLKYIYQIDGDTLRIATRQMARSYDRPENFEQAGLTIWTFKREK
jgi:uncharacterized protein (TIGR03067 family)